MKYLQNNSYFLTTFCAIITNVSLAQAQVNTTISTQVQIPGGAQINISTEYSDGYHSECRDSRYCNNRPHRPHRPHRPNNDNHFNYRYQNTEGCNGIYANKLQCDANRKALDKERSEQGRN